MVPTAPRRRPRPRPPAIAAAALLVLVALSAAAPAATAQAEPYHNYQTLKEDVRALVDAHPDIARYRVTGTSVLGLEIFTVDVAANLSGLSEEALTDLPALYVDGGHHGNEQLSIEAVYYLLAEVLATAADDPSTLAGKRLTVTPVVNPDGYVRDFRTNANQVDLNRNYPFHFGLYGTSDHPASFNYRGPAPASEPETRANVALMEELDLRAYLSGHTGTYDLVLPWRESEDGAIPDWPVYEAYLAEVENATGLPYRDPSGAGESIAWGYGNRTALSLVVEVSEEQFNPATQGEVKERLEPVLDVYRIAWTHLLDLQGRVEVVEATPTEVTVRNVGWAPAYNVTAVPGTDVVSELAPGETATLGWGLEDGVPAPGPGGDGSIEAGEAGDDVVGPEVRYRRVRIVGDHPVLGLSTVPLDGLLEDAGPAGTGGGQALPALQAAAVVAALLAGALVLGRRRRRPPA